MADIAAGASGRIVAAARAGAALAGFGIAGCALAAAPGGATPTGGAKLGEPGTGETRASEPGGFPMPWARVTLRPGGPVDMRPFPPKAGRSRCIDVTGIAGAQMFSDRAIELTMKNGSRYRLFFARECPALSFYQGFYYRRQKAGVLCAGRDVVGARSGGECPIASIIPVRRFKR